VGLKTHVEALYITDLLQTDHPAIRDALASICQKNGIQVNVIRGAKDLWCRDFMPVQVAIGKSVQFKFQPKYYQHPKWIHLQTDVSQLRYSLEGQIVQSDIILDGGNLCRYQGKYILTDRIFQDNSMPKGQLLEGLYGLLDATDILVIPRLPYDVTGHADGMVCFVEENTLLVSDFSRIAGKKYCRTLYKLLGSKYNVILFPNNLHLNERMDDATGDYINLMRIGNLLFVPGYGCKTDEVVSNTLIDIFPSYSIHQINCSRLTAKGGGLHCATWSMANIR
jgi:agmatine deiminase